MVTGRTRVILLVGNDLTDLESHREYLQAAGYQPSLAKSVDGVWKTVFTDAPSAVVINARDEKGVLRPWGLCQDLARAGIQPLIMIVPRPNARLRLKAFESGAVQVFALIGSERQLAAFLDSQLATLDRPGGGPAATVPIEIDWENHGVMRGNQFVSLSRREFALLSFLAKHLGRTVPHEEIAKQVWKSGKSRRALLKIYIRALRQKIEVDPLHPRYLTNVYGVGYRLEPDGLLVPPAPSG